MFLSSEPMLTPVRTDLFAAVIPAALRAVTLPPDTALVAVSPAKAASIATWLPTKVALISLTPPVNTGAEALA